ncbi:hypothetical protein A1F94_005454 [Pyrenophora tritici-repentis]|nr:hypothetical protein PtrV1_08479 [Pyrenophora tritici-repentis]KAF7449514.1 hypothetical protein A1F99_065630 [Pyrenophora tritici-repentis]KAG9383543.1 hypothetical protein A1F94_005454 [Pyrenophora tritici-repentis]PWO27736.1 hypothetical protein PtrARCrB10_03690 [Pyrenophora tritici-repentis]PZC97763.1 hypothetical protein A1F95_04551 [Pyrenophora tritici-repentis]
MATTITTTPLSRTGRRNILTQIQARSRKQCWPSPQDSVGRFLVKIGGQSCWEAIGPARDIFLEIGPVVKEYLDKHSEPKPSWITWSLYMIGVAPESSTPTIIFCSENEEYRKDTRDIIKASGTLRRYAADGFALKHLPRAPDYNQLVQSASVSLTKGPKAKAPDESLFGPSVMSTSIRLDLGQRLYIHTIIDNIQTTRISTAGPMICIKGVECLLTAAHVFNDTPIQSHNIDNQLEDLFFSDSDSDDALEEPTPSFKTINPLTERDTTLSLHTEVTNTEETTELVDKSSTESTSVEVPEDASYIGDALILSSEGPQQGLDYALIRLRNRWRTDKGEDFLYPKDIYVRQRLFSPHGHVITVTASTGLNHGIISETPTYMRVPNAAVIQEVYCVRLVNPVANGDCGSWVFDVNSGRWRGHIVAGCPTIGTSYIVPVETVLEDIWKNLHRIKDRLKQFEEHEKDKMMEMLRQMIQETSPQSDEYNRGHMSDDEEYIIESDEEHIIDSDEEHIIDSAEELAMQERRRRRQNGGGRQGYDENVRQTRKDGVQKTDDKSGQQSHNDEQLYCKKLGQDYHGPRRQIPRREAQKWLHEEARPKRERKIQRERSWKDPWYYEILQKYHSRQDRSGICSGNDLPSRHIDSAEDIESHQISRDAKTGDGTDAYPYHNRPHFKPAEPSDPHDSSVDFRLEGDLKPGYNTESPQGGQDAKLGDSTRPSQEVPFPVFSSSAINTYYESASQDLPSTRLSTPEQDPSGPITGNYRSETIPHDHSNRRRPLARTESSALVVKQEEEDRIDYLSLCF